MLLYFAEDNFTLTAYIVIRRFVRVIVQSQISFKLLV
jgi:hypothetical protein